MRKMLPEVLYKQSLRILWFLVFVLLASCSGDSGTGPVEVRWDRDACERCRMVLSDPHFAAQVRYFPEGKRAKVVKFDDVGCAVIWLQENNLENDSKAEIWVADHRSREWIDARSATYVLKKTTPMEYGLGAQSEQVSDGMNFEQAKQHIADIETRFNVHGLQLKQRLKEQAQQRDNTK